MKSDHYRELGVERDADLAAIKSGFRRIARKHHPDVSRKKGSADRFRCARAAYEVLSDPVQRAHYDRALDRSQELPRSPSRRPVGAFEPRTDLFAELEEAFIELERAFREFGLSAGEEDVFDAPSMIDVELSREEAMAGCDVPVQVLVEMACEDCGGAGWHGFHICASCSGTGVREVMANAAVEIPSGVRHGETIVAPLRAPGFEALLVRARVLVSL